MANTIDYIQEIFNALQLILNTPIVLPTARRGVLWYCTDCGLGDRIGEDLLSKILGKLINSETAEGQYNIMVRQRFVSMELDGQEYKAYKREVQMISWDSKQYVISIGIRNLERERRHRHCAMA